MKARDIQKLGYPDGPIASKARAAAGAARVAGMRKSQVKGNLKSILLDPAVYAADEIFGELAQAVIKAGIGRPGAQSRAELASLA